MKLLGIDPGRLSALALRTAASSWGLSRPFKATVALTYRCPHRCYFCGIWKREEAELTPRSLAAAFRGMRSVTWLDVTGGEIFARDDFLEACLSVVEILPDLALFHFPTSGVAPERAEELARAVAARGPRVVVSVAVQGPPELHDRVSGAPGAFSRAVETLHRLRRVPNVDAYVGTTLLRENVDLVPDGIANALAQHVPGLRKGDFHFNVMQGSGHYFCNASAARPGRAAAAAALRRVMLWKGLPRSPFDALEAAWRWFAVREQSAAGAVPRCAALRCSFFVSPSGVVYPCHIWAEPLGRTGPMLTLADLLASGRGNWLRAQVAAGRCPGCWTPCEAYPTLLGTLANPLAAGLTRNPFRW